VVRGMSWCESLVEGIVKRHFYWEAWRW